MSSTEIIALIVTIVCLVSFCTVFTVLFYSYYRNNIEAVSSGKEDTALIDNAIDEEKEKNSRPRKIAKKILNVLSYVVLGVIFVVFAISLVGKFSGGSIIFGDSTMIVIASGSMSQRNSDTVKEHPELTNQFNTYDMIGITKYKSQDDVSLYDVVAYKNKNGTTIVHRIVEMVNVDSSVKYLTQGDSNTVDDSGSQYDTYLDYDSIIGKYDGRRIQTLGIFVLFLQSPAGAITVVSVLYCILMYDVLSSRYKKAIVDRTNILVSLIDYDLSKPRDEDEFEAKYHETIHYRGNKYILEDGKFVGKEEAEEEDDSSTMVVVKSVNGKNTVTVKDTMTNKDDVYEDVSDEDIKDVDSFKREANRKE